MKTKKRKREVSIPDDSVATAPVSESDFGGIQQDTNIDNTEDNADMQYKKKINKQLPTRAERLRRENQRRIQTYVAELRTQGYNKKDIDKLKKKAKKKLQFIQKDIPISSVISDMSDQTISCRDCEQDFIFSAREQVFYKEKGFTPAIRCKECTAAKKERMSWVK